MMVLVKNQYQLVTDPAALNYFSEALEDDGSCEYPGAIYGCIDSLSCNYNSSANIDDNSCYYSIGDLNCDQIMNFEITQFNLITNTPYLIKDGLCEVESYYFISDEYYITGNLIKNYIQCLQIICI